jgi:bifunctional non-homologous end joining protein LigD
VAALPPELAALPDDARAKLRPAPTPAFVPPMLATLTDERAFGDGWLFEHKLDGVRLEALVRADADVRLLTRTEHSATARYPAVAAALAGLGRDVVLDGEVVAMDGDEPLGFQRLQQGDGPVARWCFDVLELDGYDLRGVPLRHRKAVLDAVLPRNAAVRFCGFTEGDGERRYAEACRAGWEGLIAKRADSPYVGGRSRDWLKLKCLAAQEVVVGGFTAPRGARTGFGALLVGTYDDAGRLRYAGKVGTGFTQRTLDELTPRLRELERPDSPFADPIRPLPAGTRWAAPELVAQVAFAEWTDAGRLRQPRFLGLRDDKDPRDVVRERAG